MTEKVNPSPFRPAEAFKTAGSIALAGGSEEGYVVSDSNPSTIAVQDGGIDETQFTAFGIQFSGTSFDITIEPGEGFVFGSWLAKDTNTTVTMPSNSTDETVYVGWDKDATNEVIVGPDDGRFATASGDTDQKIPLWDVTTDGSGVTSVTDVRVIGRRVTGQHVAPTSTESASFTTSGEQILFVDTSGGPVTVTLSDVDTTAGNEVIVTDVAGNANLNNITIDTQSGQTIDGQSSVVVDQNYGAQRVASDGTNWWTTGESSGGRARIYRAEDALIGGDTLESGDELTIASNEQMVVGGSYTINGDATIDGDLVTVTNQPSHDSLTDVDPTDHLEVVKEYQITASSGSTPAFDGTMTNALAEELTAFDVTVTPTSGLNDTYAFNYDDGKHWNNGSWDVPLTVNWDEDPGQDLDLTVRIHKRT